MVEKVTKRTITEKIDEQGNKQTTVKEHPEKIIEKKPRKPQPQTEKKMSAREREELLIDNFVGIQHAMTNLSIKFGLLSENINKLLQVFEESAKNLMEGGKPYDDDIIKKVDELLDQNKTIARGLLLMQERNNLNNEVKKEEIHSEQSFKPASFEKPAERHMEKPIEKPPIYTPTNPQRPRPLPRI